MASPNLTHSRLLELLDYDPDTGLFTWRIRVNNNGADAGDMAGCINTIGYIQIGINGTRYLAHRLAFLYVTGKWPDADIDHINSIRSDNKWCNLRPATRSENLQNLKKAKKHNKCGLLGVRKNTSGKTWSSRIVLHRIETRLGTFGSPEEAHEAYLKAKEKLHPFSDLVRSERKRTF